MNVWWGGIIGPLFFFGTKFFRKRMKKCNLKLLGPASDQFVV